MNRGTVRAMRAAVALSWRAGAAATVGVWVLSAASGFTPAMSAWFVRLLIDELNRPAPSARRAVLFVLGGAAATLITVAGAQLGQLVTATLHRAITVDV
ncbi:MAG TPA: ABC transporter ATP-binding protein, partial [Micromonosporaceae bacterium]